MSEISQVSHTAHWVATYRALETESAKPLFVDPFARSLAGDLGFKLLNKIPLAKALKNFFIMRTKLIDDLVLELLATQNIDVVINIGSGLDTRPYRLSVPTSLHWVEIDSAAILEYKSYLLQNYTPHCQYLSFTGSEGDFESIIRFIQSKFPQNSRILFITEGLLPYLKPQEVQVLMSMMKNSSTAAVFWIFDNAKSPIINFLGKLWQPLFPQSNLQFRAPTLTSEIFSQFSFRPYKTVSILESMIYHQRVPWSLKFLFFTSRFWISSIRNRFFSQSTVNIYSH